MKSTYDLIVEQAMEDGTYGVLDPFEDMETIKKMNDISAEIRYQYIQKQRASEIEASKFYINSPPLSWQASNI